MIDGDRVELIRNRWERIGLPLLEQTAEAEMTAVRAAGGDPAVITDTRWFDALWTIWDGSGSDAAAYVTEVFPSDKTLSEYLPDVSDAVRTVAQRARSYADRTRQAVLDLLNRATLRALDAELALLQTELGSSLAGVIGSEVVSATAWAQNQTATFLADSAGQTLLKIWRTRGDDRVRPSHVAAEGQRRELHQFYTVGPALLRFPGDPSGPPGEVFNCRCFETYEPVARAPQRVGLGRRPPILIPVDLRR